jgi:DNA invertase Pin-like site-specific DNA recombinase
MQWTAIYVRVSSRKQEFRSQEPDMERWTSAFGDGQPVRWYRDKVTGKTMDRAGWRRLEADLDAGQVSRVVVWRLDRLGRTASGLTTLFEKLAARKIGLVSLRDGLDLSTPGGRLMANMLASVAVYENEVRSERILAGQAAARAEGKRWGGSVKGRRVKVQAEQIAAIRRSVAEGQPIAAIARATGLSRPTVYSVLNAARQPLAY